MSPRAGRILRRSYRRPGRLIPRRLRGLRAGAVILQPNEAMAWHSTGRREELLVLLAGRVEVQSGCSPRPSRRIVRAGECAFIPRGMPHSVVNRSRTTARYLYITAPAA